MVDIEDIYDGLAEDEGESKPAAPVRHYGPTIQRMEQFRKALPEHNYNITATCKAIGLTPSAYYKWLDKDPEFREYIDTQRRQVFDYAFDLAKLGMMGDLDLEARDRIHIALQLLRLQKMSEVNITRSKDGDIEGINIKFV